MAPPEKQHNLRNKSVHENLTGVQKGSELVQASKQWSRRQTDTWFLSLDNGLLCFFICGNEPLANFGFRMVDKYKECFEAHYEDSL